MVIAHAPVAHVVCPRCAGPNDCGPAHGGTFDGTCWCACVTVPTGLIDALAPSQRSVACLCARCIASHG